MRIWKKLIFLINVLWSIPPSFTHLTFKFTCLQKVTGLREVSSSTYSDILKGPLPSSTKQHQEPCGQPSHQHQVTSQNWEVYSQVNYEYHGLFHQSFIILTLEIKVASGHCFPHPNFILHMAFKASPLLTQCVWHLLSVCRHSEPHFNLH